MQRHLLIAPFILLFHCSDDQSAKWEIAQQDFKRTQSMNYSEYISGSNDTGKQAKQNNLLDEKIDEPIPAFSTQTLNVEPTPKEETNGFFDFLIFWSDENDEEEKRLGVCEELLDINKIVVADQNQNLKALTSENEKLLNKITNLESELEKIAARDQYSQLLLENEINRLNNLIKLLTTEIK